MSENCLDAFVGVTGFYQGIFHGFLGCYTVKISVFCVNDMQLRIVFQSLVKAFGAGFGRGRAFRTVDLYNVAGAAGIFFS